MHSSTNTSQNTENLKLAESILDQLYELSEDVIDMADNLKDLAESSRILVKAAVNENQIINSGSLYDLFSKMIKLLKDNPDILIDNFSKLAILYDENLKPDDTENSIVNSMLLYLCMNQGDRSVHVQELADIYKMVLRNIDIDYSPIMETYAKQKITEVFKGMRFS